MDNASFRQFLQTSTTENLICDLEFIVSNCFLSGIRGTLSKALSFTSLYVTGGTNVRTSDWLLENGMATLEPNEYREQAKIELDKACSAYESIPYCKMDKSYPIHAPFFKGRDSLRLLKGLNKGFYISNQSIVLLFDNYKRETQIFRDEIGDEICFIIKETKKELKNKLGVDFSFSPNLYLRPERQGQLI